MGIKIDWEIYSNEPGIFSWLFIIILNDTDLKLSFQYLLMLVMQIWVLGMVVVSLKKIGNKVQHTHTLYVFTLLTFQGDGIVICSVYNQFGLKSAHFGDFVKNRLFCALFYYKITNFRRHLPFKSAPMCAKAHTIDNTESHFSRF